MNKNITSFIDYKSIKLEKILKNDNNHHLLDKTKGISYFSGDHKINNNAKALDKKQGKITCRHLSWQWLLFNSKKQPWRSCYSNVEEIGEVIGLKENHYDTNNILDYYDSLHICYHDQIGEALYNILNLSEHNNQYMLLNTYNHQMSIKLSKKYNPLRYVVNFFDPNHTTANNRIIFNDIEDIKNLKFSDLVPYRSDLKLKFYFPNFLSLFITTYNNPHELSNLSNKNHHIIMPSPSHKVQDLSSILFFQLYLNVNHGISEIVKMILNSNLNIEDKINVLRCRSNGSTDALFVALQRNNAAAINIFIREILDSDLSLKNKVDILNCRINDGTPGLFIAFQENNAEAINVFVKELLESDLSLENKIDILNCRRSNGTHGLFIAFQENNLEAVNIFVREILDSDLSLENKVDILNCRRNDGTPGLVIAFQQNNAEVIKVFTTNILESNLPKGLKIDILQGYSSNNLRSFEVAIRSSQKESAFYFVAAIINYLNHVKYSSELSILLDPILLSYKHITNKNETIKFIDSIQDESKVVNLIKILLDYKLNRKQYNKIDGLNLIHKALKENNLDENQTFALFELVTNESMIFKKKFPKHFEELLNCDSKLNLKLVTKVAISQAFKNTDK